MSKDSCLYTEDWLLRLAAKRTGGSFASDRIVRYYLGTYKVRFELLCHAGSAPCSWLGMYNVGLPCPFTSPVQ